MISINERFKKIKTYEADLIISATIILVAFLGFGLGRLSKIEENKAPISIENIENIDASVIETLETPLGNSIPKSNGKIVASKSGTKYHFPWCSGALRIKDDNKIWFFSEDEAKKAGYTPATNCKGLK